MFERDALVRALDLQTRSHGLLRWLADAVRDGVVSFKAAHGNASIAGVGRVWIQDNYDNLPPRLRPSRDDLADYSGLFATYLENSFELVKDPGTRLYSPGARCFCPWCSWLVDVSNLKTRIPSTEDKRRSRRMMRDAISRVAFDQGVYLSDAAIDAIAEDPALREKLALCAYGADLLHRMRGVAVGPAALALWRTFAWLPTGSPKKNFKLTPEMILDAERDITKRVLAAAERE
jgi:hypothetical protein